MRKWLMCGAAILVLALASSCGIVRSGSAAKHPIPPPVERLELDRCWVVGMTSAGTACSGAEIPGAPVVYSLADEDRPVPRAVFSAKAMERLEAWKKKLITAYCEGREALQVANGETPKPAPVCEPAGK